VVAKGGQPDRPAATDTAVKPPPAASAARPGNPPAAAKAAVAPAVPAAPVWAADVDRRVRQGRNSAVVISTVLTALVGAVAISVAVMLRAKPADMVAAPPTDGTMATPNGPMRVEYQEYGWQRGDGAVRMIRKEEGFCYLTRVNGQFAGLGEEARVYIGDDGYWYLSGSAYKPLAATAMSVRFMTKPFASAASPGQETWEQTILRLASSNTPEIRELAKAEQSAPPADGASQLQFADFWRNLLPKIAAGDRAAVVEHVLRSYQGAGDGTAVSAEVAQKADGVLQTALNDLSQWKVQSGTWNMVDGKICGRGWSELLFLHQLPRDCTLEFRMNTVEGIRPRVRFPSSQFYIGNEEYKHDIRAFGAVNSQESAFPYANNQELAVALRFQGDNFELRVNGQLTARGVNKAMPDHLGLRLSAGDDWSPGVVLYWDFKLTPAGKPIVSE
jgi:hypothetical protein